MSVSFEDPIVITENDIISIDIAGIKYKNSYIDFSDCANNYSIINGAESKNCVADRDATGNPNFNFYTTGRVTQLFFVSKCELTELITRKNTYQRFHELNKQIQGFGWSTYDIS